MRIQFINIHKRFQQKEVFKDLSVNIESGDSVAFVGSSGIGKSVALKILLGLISPDNGAIHINNKKSQGLIHMSGEVRYGMLFQSAALFDSLNVIDNVAFGLINGYRKNKKDAHHIALQKLLEVGLDEDVTQLKISDLSGGMKKRVGLARALVLSPQILLFDEPTTGLDPPTILKINTLLAQTIVTNKSTSIVVTHDLSCVDMFANRVVFLDDYSAYWQGSKQDFFDDSITKPPKVQSYLQDSGYHKL